MSRDGNELEKQLTSLPEGATVTGGRNNTTFIRREADVWSSAENPEEYYNDADLAWRLSLSYGTHAPVATMPQEAPAAPSTPVAAIHDKLPVGTLLPSAEGSTSGMKRVGPDKWEMIKDGQPTGRFVTDDTVKVFQELMGTSTVAPKDNRFGNNVGMYAEDLNLPGGQSLGAFLENGGSFGALTNAQKQAVRAGYARFIENLNTELPAGFRAELRGDISFESGSMTTYVQFFQGGRELGPAQRRFSITTDSRTGKRVSSVEHAYWDLASDVQGSGISAAFLKASKQMYRQMGLDRITVHADISIGSYAWARGGFDFRSAHYMASAMTAWDGAWGRAPRGREAEWADGIRQFKELRAKATAEAFLNGTHPPAVAFSNIGRPTSGDTGPDVKWFGKEMLKHTHWYGDFMLNSAAPSATVDTAVAPAGAV